MVNLKDFVNGQAYSSQAAFHVDGVEERWSVDSLLEEHLPEGKPRGNKRKGNSIGGDTQAGYSKVTIYYGSTSTSLWRLTQMWREALKASWTVGEERRDMEYSQKVVFWMEQNAPTSQDGGRVCVYCGMVCKEHGFSSHMNIEHLFSTDKSNKQLRFKCFICNMVVAGGKNRKHHMKKMHGKVTLSDIPPENRQQLKLVNCPSCKEAIVISLHDHWHQHHEGQSIACEICHRTFKDPWHLSYHMKQSDHSTEKSGVCKICDNKAYRDIKRHRYTFHSQQTRNCIPCNKTFLSRNIFDRHRKNHMIENGKEKPKDKKQCPECQNFYQYLEQHIWRFHKGKRIRRTISEKSNSLRNVKRQKLPADFKCGMCETEFKRGEYEDFNKHLRKMHFRVLFNQPKITYSINTKDPLEREKIGSILMQIKADIISPNQIQCKFCQREMPSMPHMLTHMKNHLGYKRHEVVRTTKSDESAICPDCGQIISSKISKKHKSVCEAISLPSGKAPMGIRCVKCNDRISDSERPSHEETCFKRKPFRNQDRQQNMVKCRGRPE